MTTTSEPSLVLLEIERKTGGLKSAQLRGKARHVNECNPYNQCKNSHVIGVRRTTNACVGEKHQGEWTYAASREGNQLSGNSSTDLSKEIQGQHWRQIQTQLPCLSPSAQFPLTDPWDQQDRRFYSHHQTPAPTKYLPAPKAVSYTSLPGTLPASVRISITPPDDSITLPGLHMCLLQEKI